MFFQTLNFVNGGWLQRLKFHVPDLNNFMVFKILKFWTFYNMVNETHIGFLFTLNLFLTLIIFFIDFNIFLVIIGIGLFLFSFLFFLHVRRLNIGSFVNLRASLFLLFR